MLQQPGEQCLRRLEAQRFTLVRILLDVLYSSRNGVAQRGLPSLRVSMVSVRSMVLRSAVRLR